MKSRLQVSIPTRRSLLSRIKNWENQESWREFYDTYSRLVYGVARHAGLSDAEAEDVVQETFCQVAKNIPKFKYDPAVGSFKSWLLKTTLWHIADQFRHRAKSCEPAETADGTNRQTALTERIPDPQSLNLDEAYEEAWKRNLQEAALARVKAKVNPKQYQAFNLYVIKGVPVADITRLLGMSRNQVYLAKLRLTRLAADEAKRLERELV